MRLRLSAICTATVDGTDSAVPAISTGVETDLSALSDKSVSIERTSSKIRSSAVRFPFLLAAYVASSPSAAITGLPTSSGAPSGTRWPSIVSLIGPSPLSSISIELTICWNSRARSCRILGSVGVSTVMISRNAFTRSSWSGVGPSIRWYVALARPIARVVLSPSGKR